MPLINTLISYIITEAFARFNYDIQRLDAALRKAFVMSEDSLGPPAIEECLQGLMRVCMKMWIIAVAYQGWIELNREGPSLAIYAVTSAELFSGKDDAPSLGDLNMLLSSYGRLSAAMSWFATSMDSLAFFRAVLRRLSEFETQAGYDGQPFGIKTPDAAFDKKTTNEML